MNKASDLTLAFINKRPESAARVLANLRTKDSAEFLRSIPTRFSVRLLAQLNPNRGAAIVREMGPAAATAVIRDMEYQAAGAVLRRIPLKDREPILADLSRRQRRNFETSLAFARDTVGARMSMAVDAVLPVETIANVLQLKRENRENQSELTFLVDDKRNLLGAVSLLTLVRYPESTVVGDLADMNVVSVSPHSHLSQLASAELWKKYSELPVVARGGELLGSISKLSILAAGTAEPDYSSAATRNVAGAAMDVMAVGGWGLLQLFSPDEREHRLAGGSDDN